MKANHKPDEETCGQEAMNAAYRILLVEAHVQRATRPSSFYQVLKGFLEALSSEDPTFIHFDIVKRAFQDAPKQDVDSISRAFLQTLHKLNKALSYTETPQPYFASNYFTLTELTESDEAKLFCENGLALWDHAFCELLSSISDEGVQKAKAHAAKMLLAKWDPSAWLKQPQGSMQERFYLTEAFLTLAAVIGSSHIEKNAARTLTIEHHLDGNELHTSIRFPSKNPVHIFTNYSARKSAGGTGAR